MLEQIGHPFDKNVYSVYLFTIEKDEKSNINCMNYEDMAKLNRKPVLQIYVRPTMSKDYMEEIVTGLLIPVCINDRRIIGAKDFEDEYFINVPDYSPVHIISCITKNKLGKDIYLCDDYEWFDNEINELLYHKKEECIVTTNQLNRYFTRHHNKERFEREISDIFQEASLVLLDVLEISDINNSLTSTKTLIRKKR